jgi:ferric-dicitrate binding protein FerR (iron transport regulator)
VAVFVSAFLIGGIVVARWPQKEPVAAFHEIIVPPGESAELVLSDQTHVWLNAGTRLRYPTDFQQESRTVELFGEAYFDVAKDRKRPFFVITKDLIVNALGTSFNVETRKQSATNITLVEGKVSLEDSAGQMLTTLSPGENAFLQQGKLEIKHVKTDLYTSWKEGIITFRDEALGDIAKKIELWYNVELNFEQESVKSIRFTGTILRNKPVDQIMEILKFTSGIDYTINVFKDKPNIIYLKKKAYVKRN